MRSWVWVAIAIVATAALAMFLAPGAQPADVRTAPTPAETPFDAAAELRPDLIVADPVRASPGQLVELHFPEGTPRGIAYVLEEGTGDGWALRYFLTADADSYPDEARWWRPGDAGGGWIDIGVGGPGPDIVPIPDTAPAGRYRICTANAGDEFCAPLEVRQP